MQWLGWGGYSCSAQCFMNVGKNGNVCAIKCFHGVSDRIKLQIVSAAAYRWVPVLWRCMSPDQLQSYCSESLKTFFLFFYNMLAIISWRQTLSTGDLPSFLNADPISSKFVTNLDGDKVLVHPIKCKASLEYFALAPEIHSDRSF